MKWTINQFEGFGNETKPTNEPTNKTGNENSSKNENRFRNEANRGNEHD